MGVPHFFKYLIENYPNIVFDVDDLEEVDHLFFDTNCLIHPCCHKIIREYEEKNISNANLENKMINEVLNYMKFLVELTKPQKSIYISIDGPAPRAKMHQQRSRRFRSAMVNKRTQDLRNELDMEKKINWDTNAITPGTQFMDKLTDTLKIKLKEWKVEKDINIILSDSYVPSEGEHKILDYIRKSKIPEEENCIIYGLDADLIFLSMVTNRPNMYLLRERMIMKNKGQSNNILAKEFKDIGFDYLSIDILKTYFHKDVNMRTDTNYNVNNLINDFIFLCFLIGNDFLPNINCIEIGLDGLNMLLKIYYELLKTEESHLVKNKRINFKFLKHLFKKISENETYLFKANFNLRKKKFFTLKYRYNDELSVKENKVKEEIHNLEYVNRKERDNIRLGTENYQSRFYKHYFYIDTNNIDEYEHHINEICHDYLKSLYWNFEYYFVGLKDFEWFYPYPKTPFTSDIYNYMMDKPDLEFEFMKTNPPRPMTQLLMVLPPQSSHLLPNNYQLLMKNENSNIIQYYPTYFKSDMINKRYLHECYPYLPLIDYKHVLSVLENIKLNKTDGSRNIFRKDVMIK
jgi:5'-3' exoribonuclease 2